MIKFIVFLSLLFAGCAVKYQSVVAVKENRLYPIALSKRESKKINNLYLMLLSLGKTDKKEALKLAKIAVLYPIYLAKKYKLTYPPNFHNFLVNINLRKKGLCYQWVEDMSKFICLNRWKSFSFHWGVANRGKLNEHNVVVVTLKNAPFEKGILLDPWRYSGKLYFNYVKNEKKYRFVEWKSKSDILMPLYGCIP